MQNNMDENFVGIGHDGLTSGVNFTPGAEELLLGAATILRSPWMMSGASRNRPAQTPETVDVRVLVHLSQLSGCKLSQEETQRR